MTKERYELYVKKALEMYEKAGIALTEKEKNSVEVVDWGLEAATLTGQVMDMLGMELT